MILVLVGLAVWAVFGVMWGALVVVGPALLGGAWGVLYGLGCPVRTLPEEPAQREGLTRRVVLMDIAHLPRTADGQTPVVLEETRTYVEHP
jgi:hypothetical protein